MRNEISKQSVSAVLRVLEIMVKGAPLSRYVYSCAGYMIQRVFDQDLLREKL